MKWKIVECYWERGDTISMGEIAATFLLLNLITGRMKINFRMSIDDRGMTRVVEASAQEGTVLVKDSPPCFVVSVVKGLERRIYNNASRRNAELDVP